MEKQWHIYVLRDRRGRPVYVGKTCDPKRRLRKHKSRIGHVAMEVLQSGLGDWRRSEHEWIEHYRRRGAQLLNRTEGGDGCERHGAASRAKMGAAQRGKVVSEKTKRKISKAHRGLKKPISENKKEAHRIASSNGSKKFWRSMSPAERERFISKKSAAIRKAARSKKFRIAVSKNRKAWWSGLTQEQRSQHGKSVAASRKLNQTSAHISAVARRNALVGVRKLGRKRLSRQIKSWWSSLSPSDRAEFLKKRGVAISRAKRMAAA